MVQTNYYQDNLTQDNELEGQENIANNSSSNFKIETELDDLEEIVISGSRVPLTELTVLNLNLLLDQLNQIRVNLPIELATAVEIVNRRQEIISEAEDYACLMIKSAEEKASKITRSSAIVRQAELDAAKMRWKSEQECEQLKKTTREQIEQWRKDAIAECLAVQTGADKYADSALEDIEQRLQEMLNIVQNGRQQLNQTSLEVD